MTERQKMLSGELYRAADPDLAAGRKRARRLIRQFNASSDDAPVALAVRAVILRELLGTVGPRVEIEPPFHCDYGQNIHVGDGLFMNFDCVILDCARVDIGANAFIGPGVHIYAAFHPLDAATRRSGLEYAKPIRIGDNCWIGGHSTICAGVTIGDGVVIGAGGVVVRDIPSHVIAVGNPCRAMRACPR